MLNDKQIELWQKISLFELDDPQAEFKFSDRLARENGWKPEYAVRVVEEYKKFMFLCTISKNGLTPPESIDQAWHLHLVYTKSYWIDFCKEILGKEIHHNPTKGGHEERNKFFDYYESAQTLYVEVFDEQPPKDIWQSGSIRFSQMNFQRVNMDAFWVVRKLSKNRIKNLLAGSVAIFVGIAIIFIKVEYVIFSLGLFVVSAMFIFWSKEPKNQPSDNYTSSGCSAGGCSHGHSDDGGCSGCGGDGGCGGCGGGD